MTNDYGNLELHKVLLSAMKDIDKICRENGLRYYIYAGTVLGAVMHGGFIPWDDDADIVMFKEDYDKFVEIIEKDYSDIYFMQTFDTDEEWYSKMSKLRILGTEIITSDKCRHNEMFIDISPLYDVPDNKAVRFIQRKLIEYCVLILQAKAKKVKCQSIKSKTLIGIPSRLPKNIIGNILSFIMENFGASHSNNVGIMCNTLTRNPYTGLSGYGNDITKRQDHINYIYLPFEDTEFMTISNWHDDLVRRYGPHYMEPYPEEKRVTKHDIKEYCISDEVRRRVAI